MITNKDIEKLAKVLATKEDIKELKDDIAKIDITLESHTTILDGLSKKTDKIDSENTLIKHHLRLL
jgi:hypothetical protein